MREGEERRGREERGERRGRKKRKEKGERKRGKRGETERRGDRPLSHSFRNKFLCKNINALIEREKRHGCFAVEI